MLKEGFEKVARALAEVAENLNKVHNSLDGVGARVDTLQSTIDGLLPYVIGGFVVLVVLLAGAAIRK